MPLYSEHFQVWRCYWSLGLLLEVVEIQIMAKQNEIGMEMSSEYLDLRVNNCYDHNSENISCVGIDPVSIQGKRYDNIKPYFRSQRFVFIERTCSFYERNLPLLSKSVVHEICQHQAGWNLLSQHLSSLWLSFPHYHFHKIGNISFIRTFGVFHSNRICKRRIFVFISYFIADKNIAWGTENLCSSSLLTSRLFYSKKIKLQLNIWSIFLLYSDRLFKVLSEITIVRLCIKLSVLQSGRSP